MKFEILEHSNYGGDIDNGHARVIMISQSHSTIIDCIYNVDNDEWHFMYENNHCLSFDEIVEFENWFIENGA